jgi:hypothetical protein
MLRVICVFVAAAPLAANAIATDLKATDIAERWQGTDLGTRGGRQSHARRRRLWPGLVCGIKVAADESCAGPALKLDRGAAEGDTIVFKGPLELAPGTAPYVVQTYLIPASENSSVALQIVGDTGGEFRAYRRSFPFEAQMARKRDPVCHAPQTVS